MKYYFHGWFRYDVVRIVQDTDQKATNKSASLPVKAKEVCFGEALFSSQQGTPLDPGEVGGLVEQRGPEWKAAAESCAYSN